ncbi:hypothetical protein A9G11_03375 [Gilliamella sp. wkB108]|uniref:hypothetical protein n=1 Tax=Gilliamella sp. wkB108 TaxID=3120256 RepID=UPI00080E81FA|nr:hypothetical protein [Gilliamella apicola]OCG24707.1 hypothetical protein A9G11_03375 [Gilliamella apicola]
MIDYIDTQIALQIIKIDNNCQLVLIDGFNRIFNKDPLKASRNIFFINNIGQVIWRVFSKNDRFGDSFMNIYKIQDEYKAYRWDGGQYGLNIQTGEATPEILLK